MRNRCAFRTIRCTRPVFRGLVIGREADGLKSRTRLSDRVGLWGFVVAFGSLAVFAGSVHAAPLIETAYVSSEDVQPGGPAYAYRIGVFEITNEQYVQFLNDALENLDNERGAHLYFDSDSGNVYIHTAVTGAVGDEGAGTLIFDSENNLDVFFDEVESQYEITSERESHPVTGVSWYGAVKFCNWLTIDFGLGIDDRAYLESPGPDLAGWRPVTSVDDTTWATRMHTMT